MHFKKSHATSLTLALSLTSLSAFSLTLDDYKNPSATCFDRTTQPYNIVADAHLHYRPFSGPAVEFSSLVDKVKEQGVLFTAVMGIGQKLAWNAPKHCQSYLDCPGEPVTPSVRNDYTNVEMAQDYKDLELIFSMTSFDLADPESVPDLIKLYDKEYPGLFKMAGELNVVKQALFPNGHRAVTEEQIKGWAAFMPTLSERGMPLALHSDLGNDVDNFEYKHLMQTILETYPNNKVIWLHLGMSSELTTLSAKDHVGLMESWMQKYPNLYLDLSWGSVLKSQFDKDRELYTHFLNAYSDRIITGSDYVAYRDKTSESYNYTTELTASSDINQYLNDKAFRNIALGQSFLNLVGMNDTYNAPAVCTSEITK